MNLYFEVPFHLFKNPGNESKRLGWVLLFNERSNDGLHFVAQPAAYGWHRSFMMSRERSQVLNNYLHSERRCGSYLTMFPGCRYPAARR